MNSLKILKQNERNLFWRRCCKGIKSRSFVPMQWQVAKDRLLCREAVAEAAEDGILCREVVVKVAEDGILCREAVVEAERDWVLEYERQKIAAL